MVNVDEFAVSSGWFAARLDPRNLCNQIIKEMRFCSPGKEIEKLIFLVHYMVAYFTSNATKKELLLLRLFSSLSTTTAVVLIEKLPEVDKKLENFVPRVGMCLAVLIIKFQHKIGTHKIHFYPQAKTWRNVANFTF